LPGYAETQRDLASPLALAILIFAVELALTLRLHSMGVFDQWNVIFDADVNAERALFAHGWSLGSFNHPLLPYLLSLPMRTLSAIAQQLGLTTNHAAFRDTIVLGVPALFSALKATCVYLTFRSLRMSQIDAALATLIVAFGFSSLIFGCIPSSYALSGAAIALMTLLALRNFNEPSRLPNRVVSLLAGIFAIGTTVSNVMHYGWTQWMRYARDERNHVKSLVKAIVIAATLLAVTLALSWMLSVAEERKVSPPDDLAFPTEFVERFTPRFSTQIENLVRFPEMLGRSYVATPPALKPNRSALRDGSPIKFELIYNGMTFDALSVALWLCGAATLAGALVATRLGPAWQLAGLASVASVLTSGVLYSCFGKNTFLYSQYWQVPAAILVGAWVHFLCTRQKHGRAAVAALTALLVIDDAYVFNVIDAAMMAATGRH